MSDRKWLKKCLKWGLLFVLMCGLLIASVSYAEEERDQGVDLMVVIDNGFSWTREGQATDPSGYRFDAVATALSLLDANASRANYVLFNTKLYAYTSDNKLREINSSELNLRDVSLPAGKAVRAQLLTELADARMLHSRKTSGGTDIGMALNAAVNSLMRNDSGNRKMIILLTDGGIHFTNTQDISEKEKQRQISASRSMAKAAKTTAEENGITIHTVLLKDTSAIDLMQNDLRTTDGQFLMATNASELPGCFARIIASTTNTEFMTATGTLTEEGSITIPVPHSSIDEMNISVPSRRAAVGTLRLVTPSGEILSGTNDASYIVQGENYTFIKVVSPEKGDWKITFRGTGASGEISAQYSYRYSLHAEAEISATTASKNDSIAVKAVYMKEDKTVEDPDLYKIPAQLILSKDGETIKEVEMNPTDGGYEYTFEKLKEFGAGTYQISIHCEGEGILQDIEGLSFILTNQGPEKVETDTDLNHSFEINIPGEEDTYSPQTWAWDLNSLYKDPDEDDLTFSIVNEPQNIKAYIKDNQLVVETLENITADEEIVVAAKDSDGEAGEETHFHVEVSIVEDKVGTVVYGPTNALTKADDKAIIRVQYIVDNITISKGSYYDIPAYLTLRKDGKDLIGGIEMEYNGEGYVYTLTGLRQFGSGMFEALVRLQSGSFVRECEPLQFELLNGQPRLNTGYNSLIEVNFSINDPLNQQTYEIQKQEIQLDSYINDPDGDALEWTISSNDAEVDLGINGSVLTVSTKRDTATAGNVKISVADQDGAAGPEITVSVTVTSIEDEIKIKSQVSSEKAQKDETIVVKSWYEKNGRYVSKEDELNTIPMYITLIKDNRNLVRSQPMDPENGQFTYEFSDLRQYGAGEYTVIVTAENAIFRKESEPQVISLLNSKPILADEKEKGADHRFDINIPGDKESYESQTWTVDLSEFVKDANGDELQYTIEKNTADVKTSLIGSVLSITTKINKPTTGTIEISTKDEENEEGPTLEFGINVVSIEDVYDQYQAVFRLPKTQDKNSDTELTLYVADENGKPVINDSYLPSQVEATLVGGGKKETVTMTRRDDGYYIGSFHTKQDETAYDLSAVINVGEIQIHSLPTTYETKNRAPEFLKNVSDDIPEKFLLGIDRDQEIDLSRYCTDPDGDDISYSVTEGDALPFGAITIDGSIAVIHPQSGRFCLPANFEFSFAATDKEGLSAVSDHVTIVIWPVFVIAAVALALIILAVLLILFRRWQNAHFENAAFEVSYGYKGLELPDGISDPLPNGKRKPVPLGDFYTEDARLASGTQIAQESLQKILVYPMSKGRVKISIPAGLSLHAYKGEVHSFDRNNQKYKGEDEINKSVILKKHQCFTVTNNESRVTFCLVEIKNRD